MYSLPAPELNGILFSGFVFLGFAVHSFHFFLYTVKCHVQVVSGSRRDAADVGAFEAFVERLSLGAPQRMVCRGVAIGRAVAQTVSKLRDGRGKTFYRCYDAVDTLIETRAFFSEEVRQHHARHHDRDYSHRRQH